MLCDKQYHLTVTAVTSACNQDVTVLCEMQHATTTDGALEMYPGAGVANIGIMLFRSSAKIFAEVPHILLRDQIMSSHCDMETVSVCSEQAAILCCHLDSSCYVLA